MLELNRLGSVFRGDKLNEEDVLGDINNVKGDV